MTHADCVHFLPDTVNPTAGLGDCAIGALSGGQDVMRYWHNGMWELHYQGMLVWPSGHACEEFEARDRKGGDTE